MGYSGPLLKLTVACQPLSLAVFSRMVIWVMGVPLVDLRGFQNLAGLVA
jgi:hypothetical protein